MTTHINRSEAVRKYFTKTPVEPNEPDYSGHRRKMVIGVGLLFLALILFLSKQGLLVFLGIASGYFGFKFLSNGSNAYSNQKEEYESDRKQYEKDYARAEPKPSDEQMDKWMDEDIEKIVNEALRRLDLEHEDYRSEPLKLGGPSKEARYALGKDGKGSMSSF